MTSEDVPSALALVNKYSSQFEIRQVFTSEEEFSHHFLCPAVPNYAFAYVVESETNGISDLVAYHLCSEEDYLYASIVAVVSTHSQTKQLIIDAIVCARDNGAEYIQIFQYNTKTDTLQSLDFIHIKPQSFSSYLIYIYNYKYPVIPEANFFYLV